MKTTVDKLGLRFVFSMWTWKIGRYRHGSETWRKDCMYRFYLESVYRRHSKPWTSV